MTEYVYGFILVGIITTIYIIYKKHQRKTKGYKCGYCGGFFKTEKLREKHIQSEEN